MHIELLANSLKRYKYSANSILSFLISVSTSQYYSQTLNSLLQAYKILEGQQQFPAVLRIYIKSFSTYTVYSYMYYLSFLPSIQFQPLEN